MLMANYVAMYCVGYMAIFIETIHYRDNESDISYVTYNYHDNCIATHQVFP